MNDDKMPPRVPFVPDDDSADHVARMARVAARNARSIASSQSVFSPPFPIADEFPVAALDLLSLVSAAVIEPVGDHAHGALIQAVHLPLRQIIEFVSRDPKAVLQIDPRKWEEIVAGAYEDSGLFDRVVLTPRSGDGGKDVVAEKDGYGSIRLIESVKRYGPTHLVPASEARDLLGTMTGIPTSKGILSTTSRFAPLILEDLAVKAAVPYRLELVDGVQLIDRLKKYTSKS